MSERNKDHKHSLVFPKDLLSDDGEIIIDWQLYNSIEPPLGSIQQLKMCSAKVHLICMDKLWFYDSSKYPQELPRLPPFRYDRRKVIRANKKQRSGKNLTKEYASFIEAWYKAHETLKIEPYPDELPPDHTEEDREEQHGDFGGGKKQGYMYGGGENELGGNEVERADDQGDHDEQRGNEGERVDDQELRRGKRKQGTSFLESAAALLPDYECIQQFCSKLKWRK